MRISEIPQPMCTAAVTGMPRIGEPAPAFTVVTTQGDVDFPADEVEAAIRVKGAA